MFHPLELIVVLQKGLSVADKEMQQEYLRRNLIHAKSVGVQAGIKTAIDRLEGNKNSPQWLVALLRREYVKTDSICTETAKHRDEVYERAWKGNF